MIPQEKSSAVRRGLQEAFGTTTIDDLERITRGLSSDLVFRIVVNGTHYLLRIMTRMNEQMDPTRIFACMKAASDGGLTPRVHYTSAEEGVSITDFVQAVDFPVSQALQVLPRTLSELHRLPQFPKEFNYVTAHRGFIWRFRAAGVLPADEVEKAFSCYEKLCDVYPRLNEDMVSSHMDLKPDNILFDGERVWLVDWQAGFVNDRYFDLAVAANFLIRNEGEESAYLQRYFNQAPDEYQRARFFLMRQFLHMLSASVFLLIGSGGNPLNHIDYLLSFEDFHRSIWAGKVDMGDKNQQIISGLVHWKRLLRNIQRPEFDDALRLVSSRHPEHGSRLFPRQSS